MSTKLTCAILLDSDSLLWKVLSHLGEDDVAECRQVCRRWRHVSYQLPVKVKLYPEETSFAIVSRFHGARAVQLAQRREKRWDIASTECIQNAINLLTSLRNLKRLESMDCCLKKIDWLDGMRCLRQLESINFSRDSILSGDPTNLVRELVHLKELSYCRALGSMTVEDPVTETRNLNRLQMRLNDVVYPNGNLLFPSLPQLTVLSIFHGEEYVDTRQLQALNTYAKTLKSLSLESLSISPASLPLDLTDIVHFSRLESLTIIEATISGAHFIKNLLRLRHLQELTLSELYFPQQQSVSMDRLGSLEKLRSLSLSLMFCLSEEGSYHPLVLMDCSGFSRLEKLHLGDCDVISQWPDSGTLKDVRFIGRRKEDLDHLQALGQHTHLEKLYLDMTQAVFGEWMQPFEKLKELTLMCVYAAQDMTSAIAAMRELEYLDLSLSFAFSISEESDDLMTALSSLQKLQTLKCNATWTMIADYVKAPLKFLQLKKDPLVETQIETLQQKVPTLKKVTYTSIYANYF